MDWLFWRRSANLVHLEGGGTVLEQLLETREKIEFTFCSWHCLFLCVIFSGQQSQAQMYIEVLGRHAQRSLLIRSRYPPWGAVRASGNILVGRTAILRMETSGCNQDSPLPRSGNTRWPDCTVLSCLKVNCSASCSVSQVALTLSQPWATTFSHEG